MLFSIYVAVNICHSTFPSLKSRWHGAAIGLTCQLLDGEGRSNLQSFVPECATTVTRRSSRLTDLSDPVRALRLDMLWLLNL